MPPQQCLWLDNEKRSLPGTNHPYEKYQKYAIRFGAYGSFDLSAEDDKLLRKSAFSATSSNFVLARSVTVPNVREVLDGFVQSTKRWWSD